jgi:hypothetical protein
MARNISIGETVVVTGGTHRGKHAVVTSVTAKMVYLTFLCSGDNTRVMAYNVKPCNINVNDALCTDNDTPTQSSGVDVPSAEAAVIGNDHYSNEELITEVRNMRRSLDKLVTLLQLFNIK